MQTAARRRDRSGEGGAARLLSRRRGDADVGEEAPPAWELAGATTELLRYVPTEAVGVYTGLLPFLVPADKAIVDQDFTARWILAACVGLVAVLWGVGVYRREKLAQNQAFRWPVGRTVLILLAFTAWVLIVPGSPFNSLSWYSPTLGAILGLAAGTAIALVQLWMDTPQSET